MATVSPQSYYSAADACYKLSTEFQSAFKPLAGVLVRETSGMAGGYQAVKTWSHEYDSRAVAVVTTATEFVRAVQHFGDILVAAGYNWACAEWRANRDPGKGAGPTCPHSIPSQLPYGADTVIGIASSMRNGPGLDSDIGDLYRRITEKVPGGEIPDGDTDKLDRAAKAWKTFADNETIAGAQAELQQIAGGLSGSTAPDVPHLTDHLTTLSTSAGNIRLAANELATTSASHLAALNGMRSGVKADVLLYISVATVVIGYVLVRARNASTTGGATVAVGAAAIESAATAAAQTIGAFLSTLGGMSFGVAPIGAAGLAAIMALTIQSIVGEISVSSESDGPTEGLPPPGIRPPVEGPLTEGPPSRPSQVARGGKSLWDKDGGEWRYSPGDKWHNPHWDYNRHDRPKSEWENIPIGNLPPVKGKP